MGGVILLTILIGIPFSIVFVALFLARGRNPQIAWLGVGGMAAAGVVLPATLVTLSWLTYEPGRMADSGEGWPLFVIIVVPVSLALGLLIGGGSLAVALGTPREPAGREAESRTAGSVACKCPHADTD